MFFSFLEKTNFISYSIFIYMDISNILINPIMLKLLFYYKTFLVLANSIYNTYLSFFSQKTDPGSPKLPKIASPSENSI